jgi:hypothetical protein
MDARRTVVRCCAFFLTALSTAVVFPVSEGRAGEGCGCCFCRLHDHFDGTTLCRWHRTWHGPNSIWQPLDPFYVPRRPDPCIYGGCPTCDGIPCEMGSENGYLSANADRPVVEVPVDTGFERLGQLPNDLGLSGATPAAPPPPTHYQPPKSPHGNPNDPQSFPLAT